MQTSGPRCYNRFMTAISEIVRVPSLVESGSIWRASDINGWSMHIWHWNADSIYFDGDRTLFATFKYVGNDFDSDMMKMKRNPRVKEWWVMTDAMQVGARCLPSHRMTAQVDSRRCCSKAWCQALPAAQRVQAGGRTWRKFFMSSEVSRRGKFGNKHLDITAVICSQPSNAKGTWTGRPGVHSSPPDIKRS